MSVIHHDPSGTVRGRTVIVGAGGFVGGVIERRLRADGVETLGVTRADIDLLSPDAGDRLAELLRPGDALVLVSARAPCKTYGMLAENIVMMRAMIDAATRSEPSYVLYISSDAVYSDSPNPLTEASITAPDNLHGVMHVARETMLRSALAAVPLGVLRPTLVYGARDPHGGYGPNRFRRLAQAGAPIVLFGEGEERRDHVSVDDVATLASLMLSHRSAGALNAATGEVVSFAEIAKLLASLAGGVEVGGTPRSGPMPHGGYRSFDPSGVAVAFPGFAFTPPRRGIAALFEETRSGHG